MKPYKAKIILETDIGNDIDDVLALMMLHTLMSQECCEILGISINKSNYYSAVFTDIINSFYQRPEIPVGYVRNGYCTYDGDFTRQISQKKQGCYYKYPRMCESESYFYESISLLRKLLSENPDDSVVIVSIGLLTNLAGLLKSRPDEYSDLAGYNLVQKKVKSVSCMGGDFSEKSLSLPGAGLAEFNIIEDLEATKYFIDNWPGEIVFSGFEIGSKILYPVESILKDFSWRPDHPGVEAYKIFKPMPYDRPTWDLTAVLQAVFPGKYFNVSDNGVVTLNKRGVTGFECISSGKNKYLILDQSRILEIQKLFTCLCSTPPKFICA